MILSDYACPRCGLFESLEERPPPDAVPCPSCGTASPWTFSAIHGRVSQVSAVRGKSDERPPDSVMLDTRPLAEGMSKAEWDAKQRNITRDITWRKAKQALT